MRDACTRSVATACAVALAAIVLVNAQSTLEECNSLLSASDCLADEYCAWTLELDTDTYVQTCTTCQSLATSQARCLANCEYYDADEAYCGPRPPTPAPTLAPVKTITPYMATQGSLVLEMDNALLTSTMKTSIETALAEAVGAETVLVGDVEGDNCGAAPLCGDDPAMISSVANWSAAVALPELANCCPAQDTARTEDCQSAVDLSAAACRSVGLLEAFCENTDDDNDRCLAIRQPELMNASLAIIVGVQSTGLEEPCCNQCTCYGDPNCVSFNDDIGSWRLCDGRDTDDLCEITKSACLQRTDHAGQPCVWKPKSWDAFWKDGSKCQIDADSPESWLTMYEADDFRFAVSQGERGVIRSVNMTTADGFFYMSADACIDGSSLENTWTWSGGAMSDAPSYAQAWSRIDQETFDVLWYVRDGNTGIFSVIRCTGTVNPNNKNKYGNYRLNIETLVEPDDFSSRSDLGGFCYTGVMVDSADTLAVAAHEEHLAIEAVCQDIQIPWSEAEALEYGRLFCGPGLSATSLNQCFKSFCNGYSFPNADADECYQLFEDRELAEGFCLVTSALDSQRQKCVTTIAEFGYEQVIEDYFTSLDSEDSEDCIASAADLPVSLSTCQQGITLQYQNDDGDWVDYLAIPDTVKLCDNQVQVLATTDVLLFTSALRFTQCSVSASCSTTDQCQVVAGIDLRFEFSVTQLQPTVEPTPKPTQSPQATLEPTFQPVARPTVDDTEAPTPSPSTTGTFGSEIPTPVPTPSPTANPASSPTPNPTSSPTSNPTPFPTSFPTSFPSDSPTSSPTPNPTAFPTPSPTSSPSDSPTPFPTAFPTSYPTSFPTAWPTMFPTEETEFPTSAPTEWTESPTVAPTEPTPYPTTVPPTPKPTLSPTPNPAGETQAPSTDRCEVQCPTNTAAPEPVFGEMVDTSVCTSTVDVIAADLDPTAYCECDMTVEGAVVEDGEGGSYIDLAATCPEYISDDQTEMMELACQLACYSATDGACDAWHINWRNHHCSLFSCGQSTPVFEVVNDHSGGYSCDYVAVPTPEPTSWEARRLSSRVSARNLFASRDESDARKKRKRGGRDLEMVDQDNVAELRKKRTRGDRDLEMVDEDNIAELRKKRTRGDRDLEETFVDDTAELRKKRTRGGRELEEEVFMDDLDLSVENYRASGLMSSKRPEGRGRALGEVNVPSRRRELTERPETQVTVQFFALFSSISDQEASVSKAVDSASTVESAVQSALSSADGFGDVEVTYIGQSPSYKIDGIRFPLAYDADQQSSATFLNAVCSALATTIAKRTSLSRVYCGTKLLDFRSIEDEAGDLVIMYRIENVELGRIQKMLRTNRGQNELKRQLAKSDIEYVKVLSASMPEYAEDDESAGNANTLAIALASVGALAVVALGTIFVVLKRRAKKREAASRQSDERLWNMVSYLSRAN